MMPDSLNSLLESSREAKMFFGSLPDFVQGGIMLKSDAIKTEDDLHQCAESIFHEFE